MCVLVSIIETFYIVIFLQAVLLVPSVICVDSLTVTYKEINSGNRQNDCRFIDVNRSDSNRVEQLPARQ
jgi:hypothetical protein